MRKLWWTRFTNSIYTFPLITIRYVLIGIKSTTWANQNHFMNRRFWLEDCHLSSFLQVHFFTHFVNALTFLLQARILHIWFWIRIYEEEDLCITKDFLQNLWYYKYTQSWKPLIFHDSIWIPKMTDLNRPIHSDNTVIPILCGLRNKPRTYLDHVDHDNRCPINSHND